MRQTCLILALAVATLPPLVALGEEAPLPPRRPPDLGKVQAAPADEPPVVEAAAGCLDRLIKRGARVDSAAEIADGACGVKAPLRLFGLPDGLEVAPPAIVTCAVAEALVDWAPDISAEADRYLSSPPTRILIGTSYECRSQNRQPGAKLSEHAFANAVDVMGFEFHKRAPITIAPRADESPESLFQAAIRTKACAHFTTVLGPGSDAAHSNHFHLDMRGRRGTMRLCQ